MAHITIAPLGATAFNTSFVNQLNNNLDRLAKCLNEDVLFRANADQPGLTSMHTDFDMNGFAILNATLGAYAMPVAELIARLKQAEQDITELKKHLKII
ncbi:hypothetical protein DH20_06725 [Pantoea agglomerans]|nr:hypothetical protein [Pantoea agglomerans]